jgi:hypothetical protein
MALPGTPLVWSPSGVSDTMDSSTAFPGAMASLQNLIPDPSTKDLWQCRPAAILKIDLAANGFAAASFISTWINVGTRVYGMVATSQFPGHDVPFCYDIPSQAFIPITGATAANTPVSPSQTGSWNPPHMDLIGSQIIVSHPGFNGTGNAFFGVINTLNQFALTWTATNTSPTPLVFPPQWVVNFNGRCFFLVNPPNQQPAVYMSDVLNPTVITNANQILTFGDNTTLTVAAGLALSNQLGGIIQALMIFKGVTNIYQVTGDYALGNLSINSLNVATGTFAPNTVQSSERGLLFMAPDGIRLIDFNAKVSDPIGKNGLGVTVPFIFAQIPSRAAAAFNFGLYRIQVQNSAVAGSPQQEWWYNIVYDEWSGPHTTSVSLALSFSNTFLVTLQGAGAKIFQSDPVQSVTSTFVENGTQLVSIWMTSLLPDTDQMSEIAMIETTIYMQLTPSEVVTVDAITQAGVSLDEVVIRGTGTPSLWGTMVWGRDPWGGSGSGNALYPRRMPWHFPLVFRRLALVAVCNAVSGLKIGRMHMRYQTLGYLQQDSDSAVAVSSRSPWSSGFSSGFGPLG